jgi:hypothetical protein
MTAVNRYIGAPIERVEDLRFLRGRGEGEYVAGGREVFWLEPAADLP